MTESFSHNQAIKNHARRQCSDSNQEKGATEEPIGTDFDHRTALEQCRRGLPRHSGHVAWEMGRSNARDSYVMPRGARVPRASLGTDTHEPLGQENVN